MAEPKKIIVLGVGGTCIDILEIIQDINDTSEKAKYEILGFLDDNAQILGKKTHGFTVLGPLDSAHNFKDAYFVNGIGSPKDFWKKKDIITKTGMSIDRFETIIHPSAIVSRYSKIGKGTVIFPQATVSADAEIGNHVLILPHSIVSHHSKVGDNTIIANGVCVSGNIKIGNSCYLGTNSSITQNTTVGDCCLIGAGSIVAKDVPDNSFVVVKPTEFLSDTKNK
jgi:sugar O-acyltransferase (sialic acid O-acetyltransferase NeuD family)